MLKEMFHPEKTRRMINLNLYLESVCVRMSFESPFLQKYQNIYLSFFKYTLTQLASFYLVVVVVVVVVVYPTPSEGWGHGGRPWSPRSRATP